MRLHRTARGAAIGLCALLMSTAAWADPIPGLYNTGIDVGGGQKPDGKPEDHYRVNGSQGTTYQHPAWAAPADAHWIAALPGGQFTVNPGTYTLTFDLTGLDPKTARISGRFSGDDGATVSLNDGPVVATALDYSQLTSFEITSGFKPGINVLTFVVTDSGGVPAGLVVSGLSGTADPMLPPAWSTGSYGSWSTTCGSATRTRPVTCVSPSDGTTLADSSCSAAGPKPATSESSYQTSGCGYAWTTGAYGSAVPACGSSTMSRTVTCTRSDGQTVDAGQCDQASKPATDAPTTSYDTCSYAWTADPWSAPSTTCGQATQTRAVSCWRSDQSAVADGFCAQAGTKPATSQSSYQTSGCGYSWKSGEWSGLVAACGSTVETRSVTCQRSDGQAVADSSCPAGDRPADQRAGTSYATCGYSWEAGSWSDPSRTCGSSTRTRTVLCRRSNGDQVDDSRCTGERPDATETVTDFSTCSYAWQYGEFGEPAPACGPSVRTRTATCLRQDGATVDGSFCGAQEPLSKPYDDFSACTFQWNAGTWSTPSACGQTTRTRTISCIRQDGVAAHDAQCDAASRPSSSEPVMDTSACTYAWQYGDWTQPSSCGPVFRTRTATCMRQDGQSVSDALCTTPRGSIEEPASDYSSCIYQWTANPWSTPSACGQTTRTRSVTCTRSDGATVSADRCDEASRPTSSEKVADTSACQYSWVQTSIGQWGACVNGSQIRPVIAECRRSDGTVVADASCASPRPTSESRACTSSVTPPPTSGKGGEVIFRRVIEVVGQSR